MQKFGIRIGCSNELNEIFHPFLENLTTDITIGQVDPREVISLFPRMLPSSSNFTRAIPSLHDIADINQVIFILIVFELLFTICFHEKPNCEFSRIFYQLDNFYLFLLFHKNNLIGLKKSKFEIGFSWKHVVSSNSILKILKINLLKFRFMESLCHTAILKNLNFCANSARSKT